MALHRWVASVEDFLTGGGHPTIGDVQPRGDLPPVCTEPYCGGLYSDAPAPAFLDRRGRPFPEPKDGDDEAADGGSSSSSTAPAPVGAGRPFWPLGSRSQVSEEQAQEDALKLAQGGTSVEEQEADLQGTPEAVRARQVQLAHAKGHLKRLDFPDVLIFPHREKMADYRVRFGPANVDNFDWWMMPNAVRIVAKHKEDLALLQRALDPFLHVRRPVSLEGTVIPKGLQLVAVKPSTSALRLYPKVGEKRALMKDHLPVELTFGGQLGAPRPNDTPIWERHVEWTPPTRVKRLDFVFQPHETMGDVQPKEILAAPAGVASGFLDLGRTGARRIPRDFLASATALPATNKG